MSYLLLDKTVIPEQNINAVLGDETSSIGIYEKVSMNERIVRIVSDNLQELLVTNIWTEQFKHFVMPEGKHFFKQVSQHE